MGKTMAVAVVAALALSACTDDPPDVGFEGLPEASESPSPDASAEAPDEIDVTTTPDEITPEWVTAVVNTLLAEYGEMEAEILTQPPVEDSTLTPEQEATLEALFEGEYLELSQVDTRRLVVDLDDARSSLLPPDMYAGLRFEATTVPYAEPQCIVAIGRTDRSGTVSGGGPAEILSAVSLVPNNADGSSPNITPWQIIDILPNTGPDGEPLDDDTMLDATLSDFGDALQHSCEEAP